MSASDFLIVVVAVQRENVQKKVYENDWKHNV